MTRFLLCSSLLFLLPAFFFAQGLPAAGKEYFELSGYISSWTQDCAGAKCALPAPAAVNRPVNLRLALPSLPGEAAVAEAAETLSAGPEGELTAEVKFYAICPYVGSSTGTPAGAAVCAGRYFQVQVSLAGAAEAFCSAALNAQDFSPWPVLMCAGAPRPGQRAGVTLHRRPFSQGKDEKRKP